MRKKSCFAKLSKKQLAEWSKKRFGKWYRLNETENSIIFLAHSIKDDVITYTGININTLAITPNQQMIYWGYGQNRLTLLATDLERNVLAERLAVHGIRINGLEVQK